MDIKGIFKKDYVIGLDIGSSSIKIAQFIKKEGGLHLVKADLKEIASSPSGRLRFAPHSPSAPRNDEEEQIVSALKDLFRGVDIKKSEVIAVINCPKTAVKIAKTPYMPKAELRDGMSLEAKNYFPFPIDDAILDFEIIGDIVEKGIRKYEVVVAVSPRKTIEKNLELLKKAGIKPASFIPSTLALQKVAEQTYSQEDKTICFVDIGKLHTELAIFSTKGGSTSGGKGPHLVLSRKIPVAGSDFTKALTGVLTSDKGKIELSLPEAERIKREIGIPSEHESKIIENKISTSQILSMIRPPVENLINEIERCFDFYREESEGGRVGSLVLFGGGASLSGLIKHLSEGLGVEVKLGDPLDGLKVEQDAIRQRDRISYRLGQAIGAALAEEKGINLLPLEIKEETIRVVKRGIFEAIATAALIISIFFYIGMKIQLGNFEKRISVAKMERSGLQPQLKKAEAYHLANMVLVDEPHWEDLFKELSNLMPGNIYLKNMRMKDNTIAMEGIVTSEDGERFLSDFILTLEKGIFKNVKLVRTKDLKDEIGNEFELSCWVD